jgi:hypothetical protein
MYEWIDRKEKVVRKTDTVSETFTWRELEAEYNGLVARKAQWDKEWAGHQAKIARMKTDLGLKDADLVTVSAQAADRIEVPEAPKE